jgi:hypothetical protein
MSTPDTRKITLEWFSERLYWLRNNDAECRRLQNEVSFGDADEYALRLVLAEAQARSTLRLVDGVPAGEARNADGWTLQQAADAYATACDEPYSQEREMRKQYALERLALRSAPALPTRSEVEEIIDALARQALSDGRNRNGWTDAISFKKEVLLSLIPTREQEKHNDVG